jgi:DNA processing protein
MAAVPEPDGGDPSDWLVLYHAPGLGALSLLRLVDRFGGAGELIQASAEQLQSSGLSPETVAWIRQPDREPIDRDLAWLELPNNHILTLRSPAYPPLLLQIPDPPPLLYVHGNVASL